MHLTLIVSALNIFSLFHNFLYVQETIHVIYLSEIFTHRVFGGLFVTVNLI